LSHGTFLSLEEARKGETKGATIKRFCKEHPSQADGRFPKLLDAMAKGTLEGGETLGPGSSEDCSDTQTPQGTSGGASD